MAFDSPDWSLVVSKNDVAKETEVASAWSSSEENEVRKAVMKEKTARTDFLTFRALAEVGQPWRGTAICPRYTLPSSSAR